MLKLTIDAVEYYDEATEEFVYTRPKTLQLEHSLVSLSKWESKWKKPFLTDDPKTTEETIDYIRCMTITQNVDPEVYTRLTRENLSAVNDYIGNSMTATTLNREKPKGTKTIVTSELIYYWMIALNVPFECQKWHLNRLLTLINVCDVKSAPPKKMSRRELAERNRALNEERRHALKTKG